MKSLQDLYVFLFGKGIICHMPNRKLLCDHSNTSIFSSGTEKPKLWERAMYLVFTQISEGFFLLHERMLQTVK